jgi:acetyl esterase/lipase
MRRFVPPVAALRAALAVAVLLGVAASPGAALARGKPNKVQVVTGVVYRQVDGVTLALDVYGPVKGGPYPAVLVVHGGGWRYGDRTELAYEADALAQDGFVAFSADYRLAPPGGTWHAMAPVDDLRAALVWIRTHAGEYGAAGSTVGGLGSSSGGNLAMMLGTTGTPGWDRLDAVVSWSGPMDLPLMTECASACYPKVVNYLGCRYQDCPSNWIAASPIDQVDAGDAPAFLANGTEEVIPLDQAVNMANALADAGVPTELKEVSGTEHAQEYENQVMGDSEAFLHRYLG